MKKTILVMALAISLFACSTPQATSTNDAGDAKMAEFKENTKVVEAGFNAFAKNDLVEFATYFADSSKFHGPGIGDTVDLSKAQLIERLTNFHKIIMNIHPNIEVIVPGLDTGTLKPDGSVRTYVRWQSESRINGTKFNQKFYAVYKFNKDHKIIDAEEFFDASGLVSAATAPKK
jgi:ketosteroid isomerase-like protein